MTERKSLFIALAEAAAIVYKEVTGQATTDAGLLSEFAGSIAMNAAIYAREGWGPDIQLVRPDVVQNGEFRDGGQLMRSRNVTYSDLCLRLSDLPAVTELLTKLHKKKDA